MFTTKPWLAAIATLTMVLIGFYPPTVQALSTTCGLQHWHARGTPTYIADHQQAYRLYIQQITCHADHTIELVYRSEPVTRDQVPDVTAAQQHYQQIKGRMGLDGAIVSECLMQPVMVQTHHGQRTRALIPIRITFSHDPVLTDSASFYPQPDTTQPLSIELLELFVDDARS